MNEPTTPADQYLGLPGEDPTRPWYASGNYTGQNWSDGKNQPSVEFGSAPVKNELDELAYYHDTAYARYKDERHRRAADEIFYEQAMKLKSKYGTRFAEDPRIAGKLVLYGNYVKQKAQDTALNFAKHGVAGLIYQGGKNILEMNARLTGTHLKTEMKDLHELYKTKSPNRAYVPGSNDESQAKGKIKVKPLDSAKNAISNAAQVVKDAVARASKIAPQPVETKEERKTRLVESQAQRLQNHTALRDAALASQGPRQVYHKQMFNLNAAKPKKKKKKKSKNAILPA